MHKILRTPELLDEILSYLSKHTKTVAARVCWMWFHHSIPFIWDTVKLNDALSVLAPFTVDSIDGGFQKPLLPNSWERFFLYANYARYLECVDIEYTALTQAMLWRPCPQDFFSKLTILHWEGAGKHIECLPSLLTPTLQVLYIRLGNAIKPDMLDALHKTIGVRSPSLGALQIKIPALGNQSNLQVSRSLGELMLLLPKLIAVAVPTYLMTPSVFTILSQLPKLDSLSISDSSLAKNLNNLLVFIRLQTKIMDDEETGQSLRFRALRQIHILDKPDYPTFTTTIALRHGVPLLKLNHLNCAPRCQNSEEVVALMESIHITCPNLETMTVLGENIPVNTLPWQVVQAILQCKKLHTLKFVNCTIMMELEDATSVAANRPFWRSVSLPSLKGLSYQVLVAFARSCPTLIGLGLILDSTLEIPTLESDVMFPSLTKLNVGISAMTSESHVKVGLFLARICRKPLTIIATRYETSWKVVEMMVNTITKGQLKIRTLEDEIVLLRSEKAILEKSQNVILTS